VAGRHHPLGAGRRNRRPAPLLLRDAAGCTHEFLIWLVGQRLSYPVAFTLPDSLAASLETMPPESCTPAYDACDQVRDGAHSPPTPPAVSSPTSNYVTAAGAAARTASATPKTPADQPAAARLHPEPDLVRHRRTRRRTHCMQMLTFTGHDARRWVPKGLRLRLFSIAVRLAQQRHLHLSAHAPCAGLLAKITTLQAIPGPGSSTPTRSDNPSAHRPVEPANRAGLGRIVTLNAKSPMALDGNAEIINALSRAKDLG
jgi:hypothetical protein